MKFSFATQIQPLNGQELNEYPHGLAINVEPWTAADRRRYPQAEQCLTQPDWCLVIDRDTREVFKVAIDEMP